MILEEVGQFIDDQGLAAWNTDLFIGAIGDLPVEAVLLNEYGGSVPESTHDKNYYERPRFQVSVRSARYPDGRSRIESIYQALNQVSNQVLGGTKYLRLFPLQAPFELNRDERGNIWFAVNYEALKELSTV